MLEGLFPTRVTSGMLVMISCSILPLELVGRAPSLASLNAVTKLQNKGTYYHERLPQKLQNEGTITVPYPVQILHKLAYSRSLIFLFACMERSL